MKKMIMCVVCLFLACGVADAAKVKAIGQPKTVTVIAGCAYPVEYVGAENIQIKGAVLTFDIVERWSGSTNVSSRVERHTVPDCWEVIEIIGGNQIH